MIWRVSIHSSSKAEAGRRHEVVRRFEIEDTAGIHPILDRFPSDQIVYCFVEPLGGVLSQWRQGCIRKPVRYRKAKRQPLSVSDVSHANKGKHL